MPAERQKTALILGAGPAGLTAALELLRQTDIIPIVLEATQEIGGLSRTVEYRGNRMDIGGHRFFSKSDRVMNWWLEILPLEKDATDGAPASGEPAKNELVTICYQNQRRNLFGCSCATSSGSGMLIRSRRSRIYFMRQFFDYPIRLTGRTLAQLGLRRTLMIAASYAAARMRPRRPEVSLEDFLVNRFGAELYRPFFESYTEKVWGVAPKEINAAWGAQRIKSLSLTRAVAHFVRHILSTRQQAEDLRQQATETSLIERFLYPRLGPGMLWERVADLVTAGGGHLCKGMRVSHLQIEGNRLTGVSAVDAGGRTHNFVPDYVLSSIPVRHLIRAMDVPIPDTVREVSDGLVYRDFITIGLLVDHLLVTEADGSLLKDTWIYIQEPEVKIGRLQIFNNWSPSMVADTSKIWIGLEYFCNDTDDLWSMGDADLIAFGARELEQIGILDDDPVLDGHVIRVPKTYPAYFGAYDRFDQIREFTDGFENLFLIGRNGMHKYNNQDHSMLTAMAAVENIAAGRTDKSNLWAINTDQDYQEKK